MTTNRDLTRDAVAFTRALTLGDIDAALAVYRDHNPRDFAFALGGLLGGFVGRLAEVPGVADPWSAMVDGAEGLET